jgi:hypothetical protein
LLAYHLHRNTLSLCLDSWILVYSLVVCIDSLLNSRITADPMVVYGCLIFPAFCIITSEFKFEG